MKAAVISDIHGNIVSLYAVLDDLTRQAPVDTIIFGGDFFAPGAATRSILEAVRQFSRAIFLKGNTDRYLLENSFTSVYSGNGWQGDLRRSFRWTHRQLGLAGWQFLAGLRSSYIARLGQQWLLAAHGSPRSDEEGLTPETTADDLARMRLDPRVTLLVGGHTHVPMDRMIGPVRVVNAGSVGIPFDGDPRACYALISNLEAENPAEIQVDLRRVEYNVEAAITHFHRLNHPAVELSVYNLRHGRPRGSNAFYQA